MSMTDDSRSLNSAERSPAFQEQLTSALSRVRTALYDEDFLKNVITNDPQKLVQYGGEVQDLIAQFSHEAGRVFDHKQSIERVLRDRIWSLVISEFAMRAGQNGFVRNGQGPAFVVVLNRIVEQFLEDLLYWKKRS